MSENTNHSEDFLDAFYRKKAQEYEVHPVPNVFVAMMAKTVLAQDPIDSFYQKKASDYQITASPTAFDNIIRQTTIYQPSTFFTPAKVGGIILGIGLVAVGTWFLLNKPETTSLKKDSIVIEKKENVIIEATQKNRRNFANNC